jgi:hypothetical protein
MQDPSGASSHPRQSRVQVLHDTFLPAACRNSEAFHAKTWLPVVEAAGHLGFNGPPDLTTRQYGVTFKKPGNALLTAARKTMLLTMPAISGYVIVAR